MVFCVEDTWEEENEMEITNIERLNILHIGCGPITHEGIELIDGKTPKKILIDIPLHYKHKTIETKLEIYSTIGFWSVSKFERDKLSEEVKTRLQHPYDILGYCPLCDEFDVGFPKYIMERRADYNAGLTFSVKEIVEDFKLKRGDLF